MLVIGLVVIFALLSFDFFLNTASRFAVNNTATDVAEFFKNVQSKNVNYGVPAFSEDDKYYYGIQFSRNTTGQSYYFSYKKYTTSTDETRYLSPYVLFSSLEPGANLNLKFCADAAYSIPVEPFSSSNTLQFLCTTSTTCDTKYTITIKSKFTDYTKSVIIDTSKDTQCKPSVYKQ